MAAVDQEMIPTAIIAICVGSYFAFRHMDRREDARIDPYRRAHGDIIEIPEPSKHRLTL